MPITVSSGGDFTPHETGVFPAVCIGIVDLGLQENEYEGEKKVSHKLAIYFDTFQTDDQYFVGWYTASLTPRANLRSHLEGWRGKSFTPDELKAFDLDNLVGKQCTLTIGLTSTGNPKITAISKAMKGVNLESKVEPFIVPMGGIGTDQPEVVGDKMWTMMLDGATRFDSQAAKPAPVNDDLEDGVPF